MLEHSWEYRRTRSRIVVVFKIWLDLARVLFLLSTHAGEFWVRTLPRRNRLTCKVGSAVAYTLFREKFSCVIFSELVDCSHAEDNT